MNIVRLRFKSKVRRTPTEEEVKSIVSCAHLRIADIIEPEQIMCLINYTHDTYPNLLRGAKLEDYVVFPEPHDFTMEIIRLRYATAICYVALRDNLCDILDIYSFILRTKLSNTYNYVKRCDKFDEKAMVNALSYKDVVTSETSARDVYMTVLMYTFTALILRKEVCLNEEIYKFDEFDPFKYRYKSLTSKGKKTYTKMTEATEEKINEYFEYWIQYASDNPKDILSMLDKVRLIRSISIARNRDSTFQYHLELSIDTYTSYCIYGLVYASLMYKSMYPRRQVTFKNIEPYAVAGTLHHINTAANIDEWYCLYRQFGFEDGVNEFPDDYFRDYDAMNKYLKNKERIGEIQYYKDLVKKLENEIEKLKQDDLESELATTKSALTQAQNNANYYRKELENTVNVQKQYDELREKYDKEHEELAKLREEVYEYRKKEEVIEKPLTIEEMAECIESFNLLIVGGHTNMISRLKTRFPDWTYIAPDSFASSDKKIRESKDCIVVMTGYVKHSVVEKFVSERVPIDYVNTVNYDSVVQRIYEIMEKLT